MTTQIHNQLTGSKFINMCVANWLLHIFVYATIPIVTMHIRTLGGPNTLMAWGVLAFSLGMVLPGPFGAHIMERRSRKSIFLRSLLVLGPVACLGYTLSTSLWQFIALQLVQGISFGLSQTALGTTLVNDILLSKQRNKGDLIYGWAGRLGIPLGFLFGCMLLLFVPISQTYWWLLVPCALSFVLVAQTNVPIKAPIKVSLLTLDRFFLPQSFPFALSMFAAPWVMGQLTSNIVSTDIIGALFFISIATGVLVAFLIQLYMRRRLGQSLLLSVSYALIITALLMLQTSNTLVVCIAYALAGCGIGGVSSRHLMDWVTTAQHCQRGTAQNTYMICWRTTFALGFAYNAFFPTKPTYIKLVLCGISLVIYLFWVGRRKH